MATTAKAYFESVWKHERAAMVLLIIMFGAIALFVGVCLCMSCNSSHASEGLDIERGRSVGTSPIISPQSRSQAYETALSTTATDDLQQSVISSNHHDDSYGDPRLSIVSGTVAKSCHPCPFADFQRRNRNFYNVNLEGAGPTRQPSSTRAYPDVCLHPNVSLSPQTPFPSLPDPVPIFSPAPPSYEELMAFDFRERNDRKRNFERGGRECLARAAPEFRSALIGKVQSYLWVIL